MFGLRSVVPVKGNLNVTAYKGSLDICVLQTLWQQFGKDLHMGVTVRCPLTFGYIVYFTSLNPGFQSAVQCDDSIAMSVAKSEDLQWV